MKTFIIYEITCLDKNLTYNYVGSTQNFRVRKSEHKSACNNVNDKRFNLKLYSTIRENGNWINWQMLPIEEYKCENKLQSRIREQYWIDLKDSKLNSRKSYISEEQITQYYKEHRNQYRITHKEELNQYKQQYHIENRNEILAKSKQKYSENRDEISEKRKQIKYNCECGVCLRKTEKAKHEKKPRNISI